jgi:hypothetical protein
MTDKEKWNESILKNADPVRMRDAAHLIEGSFLWINHRWGSEVWSAITKELNQMADYVETHAVKK